MCAAAAVSVVAAERAASAVAPSLNDPGAPSCRAASLLVLQQMPTVLMAVLLPVDGWRESALLPAGAGPASPSTPVAIGRLSSFQACAQTVAAEASVAAEAVQTAHCRSRGRVSRPS